MKIDLGGGQSLDRAETDNDGPAEQCVWVTLRCTFDGVRHQVVMTPATARELYGALRQFDSAGLLEDVL